MDLKAMTDYVRAQHDAVVSSIGPAGLPQSAYLDITAAPLGDLVFNAREGSRKIDNLRRDPRLSAVVGGRDGTTLQCEGLADEPRGLELERCAAAYAETFPQFADSLASPGIVLVRVRLTWARFGDFRVRPPELVEVALPTRPA